MKILLQQRSQPPFNMNLGAESPDLAGGRSQLASGFIARGEREAHERICMRASHMGM
jgi:hypothetical protein